MARLWGGRTLLGSATPSLETWLNAESGKYGRAVLAERYGDARPPEIFVSDTIRAAKRGERHAHFNKLLLDKMEETLGRGGQVMLLFQNRRGFSPYVECSVRVDGPLSPLQCDADLPQGRRQTRLPLLRLHGPGAGEVPFVRGDGGAAAGIRHGEGREERSPGSSRSPRRPAGS